MTNTFWFVKIGKPVGLKGWAKVNSFTRPEENLKEYKKFYLGKQKNNSTRICKKIW